jgi:membrane protein DedA with SNARE-associated domain/rhodanese-related sulfurtransferase
MHSAMEFLLKHGHIVIFVAVFIEQIGLPIPSGPVLLAAGALAGLGRFNLLAVLALAVGASLICDSLWFWLGRRRGTAVLTFVCRVSIEPDTCVSKTHSAYMRYGSDSLLISKFLPWFGTLGPPMAGMFGLAAWKFVLLDAGGALVWSGAYVAVGWVFRRQLEDLADVLSRFGAWFGVAMVAALAVYVLSKFVRRRRLYRSLRAHRITPRELKQRMEAGEPLVVVDLRTDIERREGCIPGALALAYEDVDSLLPSIGQKDVVFYCSCPNEITSVRAALRLKRHGVTHMHALLGGFSGWREQGFPVQTPLSPAADTPKGTQRKSSASAS